MSRGGAPDPGCAAWHCVTCADDGDPMTVLAVDAAAGLASCRGGDGAQYSIETALVEPVEAGEVLLVHAGTAIARLAAREAWVS